VKKYKSGGHFITDQNYKIICCSWTSSSPFYTYSTLVTNWALFKD